MQESGSEKLQEDLLGEITSCVRYTVWEKKASATSAVTSEEASFELGINSQGKPTNIVKRDISINPTVNVNISKVAIDTLVLNINQPEVTVSPVINLNSKDLVRSSDGTIQLLSIKVALMININ